MPAVLKITLAILLSALLFAPAASASPESSVRHAVQDWKSAMRHSDGARACGRMTLHYRRAFIGAFIDSDPTYAGMGCESLVDWYGRLIYIEAEVKGWKPSKIRMHGTCADWKRESGGHSHTVKQDGRWKLAGPGRC
jgi:hypothetical protein